MISMSVTYNGQPVSNIGDAVRKAVENGIKENIQNQLAHLEPELNAEGVQITVDMQSSQIKFDNISPELMEKVNQALHQ